MKGKMLIGAIIAIVIVAIFLLGQTAAFTLKDIYLMVILATAIILWSTEIIDSAVTGLLVIVSLVIFGLLTFADSWGQMGKPIIALLLSVYCIGQAVQYTGLDKRIVLKMLLLARGKRSSLLLTFMLTTYVFTFLIPTSLGRASIVITVANGVAGTRLKKDSNLIKAIFIAIPYVSLLTSSSVITGSAGMIYAADVFATQLNFSFSYVNWLIAFMPLSVISVFGAWRILLHLFPSSTSEDEIEMNGFVKQLQELGSISKKETKLIFIIVLMVGGWITNEIHGLETELIALICTLLLFMPGNALLKWKDVSKSINWGSLILFASSLALAESLYSTGVAKYLTEFMAVFLLDSHPWIYVVLVFCLLFIIRLFLNNMTAALAVMLPIIISLAQSAQLNPLWLGMVTVVSCCMGFILPSQSGSLMASYGLGYFTTSDLRKPGIMVTLMLLINAVFISQFYWPLIGFSAR